MIAASIVGIVGVLAADHIGRVGRSAALSAAILAGLAAPTAASIATAAVAHTGALPTAAPSTARFGGFGGGAGVPGGRFPGGGPGTGGGFPGGGAGTTGTGTTGTGPTTGGTGTANRTGNRGTGGTGGGISGILGASTPSAELTAALQADADQYTWVAATIGANQAAGYQLASEEPVMAIGGFNGTDPWPTLAVFQQYVAEGRIHYFIAGGNAGKRQGGGSAESSEITQWVAANFTPSTIGATTVYDLTGGASS